MDHTRTGLKRYLIRTLMVAPPILFVWYVAQSTITLRGLMSKSSSFHIEFANNLVQDYLNLDMAADMARLKQCLDAREPCTKEGWLTLEGEGAPYATLETDDHRQVPVYVDHETTPEHLKRFIERKAGLGALFERRHHEPIYWFHIFDPGGNEVYRSGDRPDSDQHALFAMERSLKGYQIEIVYNSFGPKQLYSVAKTKINFGAIFFLFLLVLFSGFLWTRAIRQKLMLARQKAFFVSTVSHEFKTPLAIMKLATETLQARRFKTPEEEQKFRDMLVNEINRLNHLVHKILSFNKIELNQIQYHRQSIDLRDVLEPSLIIFQTRAHADKVTLNIDRGEVPCPIYVDPDLIRHAIDNIIENAFKYRGDSQQIDIRCSVVQDEVLLSIRDYGVGIAADEIPHIHKSFYRVDDPETRGIRGSGLGLAISSYLIRHSEASLEIDSEPGQGSTFTLHFPRHQPAEQPVAHFGEATHRS